MNGVAAARLAALTARHVPRVGCALAAVLTSHIWQTATLTAAAVAVTVIRRWTGGGVAAQVVANTL